MNESLNKLNDKLREIYAEERKIKQAIEEATLNERIARQEKFRPLANKAHNLLCPYNHTDGCGWGYEHDDWNGRDHQKWLNKIENLIDGPSSKYFKITIEELNKVLDTFDNLKKEIVHLSRILTISF